MSAPTVACVMLANGRPEMVKRAVASFRAQTYERKWLYILDSGSPKLISDMRFGDGISYAAIALGDYSICNLRNTINKRSNIEDFGGITPDQSGQIICHWDSDDWSHPNRIAEQVALLQSSGAECVGYNEMLFWCTLPQFSHSKWDPRDDKSPLAIVNEGAWLYRASVPNYAIGTSMCYWRSTWERNPFPDRSEGCDDLDWFNRGVKIVSQSSIDPDPVCHCGIEYSKHSAYENHPFTEMTMSPEYGQPRMIASIHGGNTCARIDAKAREWQRVPEWDTYCRTEMAL